MGRRSRCGTETHRARSEAITWPPTSVRTRRTGSSRRRATRSPSARSRTTPRPVQAARQPKAARARTCRPHRGRAGPGHFRRGPGCPPPRRRPRRLRSRPACRCRRPIWLPKAAQRRAAEDAAARTSAPVGLGGSAASRPREGREGENALLSFIVIVRLFVFGVRSGLQAPGDADGLSRANRGAAPCDRGGRPGTASERRAERRGAGRRRSLRVG